MSLIRLALIWIHSPATKACSSRSWEGSHTSLPLILRAAPPGLTKLPGSQNAATKDCCHAIAPGSRFSPTTSIHIGVPRKRRPSLPQLKRLKSGHQVSLTLPSAFIPLARSLHGLTKLPGSWSAATKDCCHASIEDRCHAIAPGSMFSPTTSIHVDVSQTVSNSWVIKSATTNKISTWTTSKISRSNWIKEEC
ncbi:uncharacterized protein LOC110436178 [Sorghum bicolor]|uniref:uncharacterized protein LOC110436178 n=1 Tax=Sorghum bicolor TaxID=4558 RepID=UPI000B425A75|nr:uncharacterized protein LOC110436178 [Sorghum bicolor]|eukprot:XP_021318222.1 uncharacterized protein LOC110436178 [Sorghum bicolor]